MKKVFLMLALLTGFFSPVKAQPIPVLTDWNINPTAGESFGYNQFNPSGFAVGSAGSQVLWNFASVGSLGHFVENCVSPASTGLSAVFPAANIALQRGSNISFFGNGAAGQECFGNTNGTSHNVYFDGEDYLHLPFTFTNSYTDSFHSFNNGIYRRGKITITADGYGTLMFPSGTFQKVLRVHFQERFIDSNTVVILDQTTDLFKWYVPWIHAPAFVYGYVSSGLTPNYIAYYLDAPSAVLGLNNFTKNEMELNVFPNPTKGILTLQYYTYNGQHSKLVLSNAQGIEAREWNFINETGFVQHELNLTDLKKGIYFLELNNSIRKKVVIQ